MVDAPKLKYKLVVVGGSSGKTSIIERFVNNKFPESTVTTGAYKTYIISSRS